VAYINQTIATNVKRTAISFLNDFPAHLFSLVFNNAFITCITLHDFPAWPFRSVRHDVVLPFFNFAAGYNLKDE
jgi:hypothetical protein